MPIRDNTVPVGTVTTTYSDTLGNVTVSTKAGVKIGGSYQSISSLNNVGPWTPGRLRLNPVVIKHGTGACTSGNIKVTSLVFGYPKQYWLLNGTWLSDVYVSRYPGLIFQWGTWDTNAASYSLNKALAKFNQGDAGVGVMLGELGETLRLVRNPLKELQQLLSKVKDPTSRSGMAGLDFLANQFLSIKYGILPLIKDIESIRKAYDSLAESLVDHLLRKKARIDWTTTTEDRWHYSGSIFQCDAVMKTKTDQKSVSVMYYQRVLEDIERRRAKAFGYDITQFPNTAYQLIQYSFVVDWWLDFGSWLSAIMPASHIRFLGGCTSQKTVITKELSVINLRPSNLARYPQDWQCNVENPTLMSITHTLERRLSSSTPVLPAFNPSSLTFSKMVSLLAMIWQRTPKHWRRA